jgi:hypothetical protein
MATVAENFAAARRCGLVGPGWVGTYADVVAGLEAYEDQQEAYAEYQAERRAEQWYESAGVRHFEPMTKEEWFVSEAELRDGEPHEPVFESAGSLIGGVYRPMVWAD